MLVCHCIICLTEEALFSVLHPRYSVSSSPPETMLEVLRYYIDEGHLCTMVSEGNVWPLNIMIEMAFAVSAC